MRDEADYTIGFERTPFDGPDTEYPYLLDGVKVSTTATVSIETPSPTWCFRHYRNLPCKKCAK